MIPTYIGLGSNLGDPEKQLSLAIDALGRISTTRLERVSSVYRSRPIGPGEQPDYLNAVALLQTNLSAHALLTELQAIESRQGRERAVRWGARTLDLDILLYGKEQHQDERLTIPHPAMTTRNFVLYPLLEIAGPTLQLPDNTPLSAVARDCSRDGLERTQLLKADTHRDP